MLVIACNGVFFYSLSIISDSNEMLARGRGIVVFRVAKSKFVVTAEPGTFYKDPRFHFYTKLEHNSKTVVEKILKTSKIA